MFKQLFFLALLVYLFSMECRAAAPSPTATEGIPTSPFTPEQEKAHSILSWDYNVLGEKSGWWGYWYPSCTLPKQSPIDIDSSAAVDGNDQLIVETATGEALSYVGVIVAFKSAFNQLHVDLSSNDIELKVRYKSQAPEDAASFMFSSIDMYIPSVHYLDGEQQDAEIVYHFVGTNYAGDQDATGTGITDQNTISMSFLLEGTTDGSANAQVETFLTQIYNGCDSGSTELTPLVPNPTNVFHYGGSQLHPPCNRNIQYFVSAEPIPIEAATITKFTEEVDSPNTNSALAYRMVKPLDGRTVTKFSLNLTTLSPTFNSAAAAVVYRMVPTPLKYTGLIERYARDMLIGIVVILVLSCVFLVVERWTYRLPYNLTWTNPSTKSEVFGVPMRYGYETGKPKVDYVTHIPENSDDGSTGEGTGSQKEFHDTNTPESGK